VDLVFPFFWFTALKLGSVSVKEEERGGFENETDLFQNIERFEDGGKSRKLYDLISQHTHFHNKIIVELEILFWNYGFCLCNE